MPSPPLLHSAPDQPRPDRTQSPWDALQAHLSGIKRRLQDEIERYPAPIPACDAQFNFLLEQRGAVAQALQRLEAIRAEPSAPAGPLQGLLDFAASCELLTDDAGRALLTRLRH
jgi:hypothetical protein